MPLPRTTLRRGRDRYNWDVDTKSGTALALLAPVLWSAGNLLAGPRLDGVRRCANAKCGWLFLDERPSRQAALVLDVVLRQPRQGAPPLPPGARKNDQPGGTFRREPRRPLARHGRAAVRPALDVRLLAGLGLPRRLFRRLDGIDPPSAEESGAARAAHEGWPVPEERLSQKIIMAFTSTGFLGLLVIPALDRRFGWSHMPPAAALAGDALVLLGGFSIHGVLQQNSFTSARIELASDRQPSQPPLHAGASSDVCRGAGDDGGSPSRSARDGACWRSRR